MRNVTHCATGVVSIAVQKLLIICGLHTEFKRARFLYHQANFVCRYMLVGLANLALHIY